MPPPLPKWPPLRRRACGKTASLPTLKHFPGHGDTAEDSHTDLAVTYKTREELENCELLPFAADTACTLSWWGTSPRRT